MVSDSSPLASARGARASVHWSTTRAELRRQLRAARRRTLLRRLAARRTTPSSSPWQTDVDEEASRAEGSRPQRSSSGTSAVTALRRLHEKQSGLDQTLARCTPARRGQARRREGEGREKVEAEIAAILARAGVRVVATREGETRPSSASASTPTTRPRALETELFGKRILSATRPSRRTAQIVADYRSRRRRGRLRQMKDPKASFSRCSTSPSTDPRPCLLLRARPHGAKLMVRAAAGPLWVRALLSSLRDRRDRALYQGERGRPRARRMLTEQDAPAALRPLRPRGLRAETLS